MPDSRPTLYLSADWTLYAPSGCQLEVGTGVKIRGRPRGARKRFEQQVHVTTWGLGAVHVRSITPGVSCTVNLSPGHVEALPIYSDPSLTDAVLGTAP